MNKIIVDREKCKGCEACIDVCPSNIISISDKGFNKLGFNFVEQKNSEKCKGCGLCALVCPEAAIEVIRNEQIKIKGPSTYITPTSYCPGCSHGVVHRLIAELIEEKNLREKAIGVTPIGCAIFVYRFLDIDYVEGAHGRAPAVATGIKRVHPDSFVFTYQGDGDIAAIGTSEIIHAANRGENFTVIFVNNGNFGMTGGQMAPTSLLGQVTATSPYGRSAETEGHPIRMSEMLATIEGTAYVERVSLHDIKNILKAKKAIKKAFEVQIAGKGFAMVEILSTCPTNWGMAPAEALKWVKDNMIPYYPLGVKKEVV